MVTIALAAGFSPARSARVIERNSKAVRGGPYYWVVLLSGFLEPVLYLLSVGIGVGALMDRPVVYDGFRTGYAAFVAPGLLAVSVMAGAFTETAFGFFTKMRQSRLLESIFVTPVTAAEIVVAELIWAVVRGAIHSTAFLLVMVSLGLTTPGRALAALPAALLVGAAFGAIGIVASTLLRGWQDFDLVSSVQVALFLFSGTFSPVAGYPAVLRFAVELTPLYHAIELLRAIILGTPGPAAAGHAAYLVALLAACLLLAARRVDRALRR